MFAIAHDGFVQNARYSTLEEAKTAWKRDIQSRFLFQYDCSVYELNDSGEFVRAVSYQELMG